MMVSKFGKYRFDTLGPQKQSWTAPVIQMLSIHAAEGANAGPLCDKHGSLSAQTGNDRCTTK